MADSISILIGIQKDQTALIYTLWNVFQGLCFVLLGYVFSQEHVRKSPLILTGFSLSVLLYAIGNHNAIMRAQKLVIAATEALHRHAAADASLRGVLTAFEAPTLNQLALAHGVFTLFVASGIWLPYLWTKLLPRIPPAAPS